MQTNSRNDSNTLTDAVSFGRYREGSNAPRLMNHVAILASLAVMAAFCIVGAIAFDGAVAVATRFVDRYLRPTPPSVTVSIPVGHKGGRELR
jgi:hypothetical protein